MKPSALLLHGLLLIPLSVPVWGAESKRPPDPLSIVREPFLSPAGIPSADLLSKGEWLLAANGWAGYGWNEKNTVTIDWFLALGLVPAGYLRHKLPSFHPKLKTALEVYFISFFAHGEVTSVKGKNINFIARQKGYQGWLHWNTTYQLSERIRWHNYIGATYDSYQKYIPKPESSVKEVQVFKRYLQPDIGTGFDLIAKDWLKLSANVIYGNSFYFLDQNPQKWAFQTSIYVAPFLKSRRSFLRNLRIEFFGGYVELPDMDFSTGLPPIFPLVMWQWQG